MPLSEHEQRMLDELEQQLHAEDPKFASSMAPSAGQGIGAKRLVVGIVAVILGLGLLVAAVFFDQLWVGVVAFVGMLAGVLYALAAPKSGGRATSPKSNKQNTAGPRGKAKGGGGFMDKLEGRWDRRRGGDS